MLSYRHAAVTDVAAIVQLVESAYRGEGSRAGWTTEADLLDGQRTDAAAVTEMLDAPQSTVLLAEDGGQLVGCCRLERRPGADAYFGMFSVEPVRQGEGVGHELLAEAERMARHDWA